MRALSIRQPWAELVARGKKKIEYRTWQRGFRGDLLVVASATRQDDACMSEGLDPDALVYGHALCIVDFWKVTGEDGDFEWHFRSPRRLAPFAVKGSASIFHVEDARIREVGEYDGDISTVDAPPGPRKPPPGKKRATRTSPLVLLLTRDAGLTKTWRSHVGGLGCRTMVARDGFAGWRSIVEHRPACVVIDVRIDGFTAGEVIERIRSEVALTATSTVLVDTSRGSKADSANHASVARKAGGAGVSAAVEALWVATALKNDRGE